MASATTPINVLILVTGSIAAVKVGLLLDQLFGESYQVRIAATKSAFHFLNRAQKASRGLNLHHILTDEDEWKEWQGMNDAVIHIELRRWAHLVVFVPLDANTLAKLAHGLCDNLVTCVMRAWEVKQKPVILCPAMNTAMWTHPVTSKQLYTLRDWYSATPVDLHLDNNGTDDDALVLPSTLDEAMFQIIRPVKKRLACGDVGIGGMASVEDISKAIRNTAGLIRAKMINATSSKPTCGEATQGEMPEACEQHQNSGEKHHPETL
ncbi:putative conserved flavoprotein [Trypanosoma rangeli]|uniref:Putative conserved flavoprotein n=1 Tax=Trypanosoma rangeli TaxID=5698 RepID=A0A3R7KRR4_TRYRA|nr:putative conserved flavoprotein [Trypanosoma rangeli]RNF12293.1 putative conserved flavoprotein [Trypanosoma rangeli]|eukprot:RNF12293.1 putative conserved flavoprotein [Trypanosoma rangeli]